MKTHDFLFCLALMGAACGLSSCTRSGNDVWEDTKSAGRHMSRGLKTLGGKPCDSRQIRSREEFECIDDGYYCEDSGLQDCEYIDNNYQASDYIPLRDTQCNETTMANMIAPQPRETPGELGSSLPGIEYFRDPNTIPHMAGIFRTIYFDYDSSLIKGQQSLQTIHQIADYMRRNPYVYVFIEGHTDERGPQAYNLALGARRSNAVRNILISEGVHPDHLFSVSYGKERPVVMEHHEEGWSKNRRAEFKVYER